MTDEIVIWLLEQIFEDEREARIPTWQPARVLAECAAKRRIIGRYQLARDQADDKAAALREVWFEIAGALELCLQDLIVPYADRPGCRAKWIPHS